MKVSGLAPRKYRTSKGKIGRGDSEQEKLLTWDRSTLKVRTIRNKKRV